MGLGAPKNRSKLSHDPNNTNWAKSTTTFGHKILSKQGWKPGDYLGAENATQSDHYTAANASHIRVILREDNLGLGAKIGGSNAETFGLSMFSGLLGRLNGKDDGTLKKQEYARRDVELRLYHASKHGTMNFVSGGLLVGDKMEQPKGTELNNIKPQVFPVKEDKKISKKRKASDVEGGNFVDMTESKTKKSKLEQVHKSVAREEMMAKKDKRKKQMVDSIRVEPSASERNAAGSSSSGSSDAENVRTSKMSSQATNRAAKDSTSKSSGSVEARSKNEKRARKEERRKRKDEERRQKVEKLAAKASSSETSTAISVVTSEAEASGTSTPTFLGGRQAVRHRYIMQKRMASQSAQALKEIFMLQPQPAAS